MIPVSALCSHDTRGLVLNMTKKTSIAAIIISITAICLSAFSLVRSFTQSDSGDKETRYMMYLGTNDRDTFEPYGTPEEVKKKVDEVLAGHFAGYTIQEADGVWTDESGTVEHEYTVVILIDDTTPEKVHAAADDLILTFNQDSVLIQADETKTEFYSGKD